MNEKSPIAGMGEQLMELNQQAFSASSFEVAYFCLAAALHCARDIGNHQLLTAIHQTAQQQSDWINRNAPENWMSSFSAIERHGSDLFAVLSHEASAHAHMLSVKRQVDDFRLEKDSRDSSRGGK